MFRTQVSWPKSLGQQSAFEAHRMPGGEQQALLVGEQTWFAQQAVASQLAPITEQGGAGSHRHLPGGNESAQKRPLAHSDRVLQLTPSGVCVELATHFGGALKSQALEQQSLPTWQLVPWFTQAAADGGQMPAVQGPLQHGSFGRQKVPAVQQRFPVVPMVDCGPRHFPATESHRVPSGKFGPGAKQQPSGLEQAWPASGAQSGGAVVQTWPVQLPLQHWRFNVHEVPVAWQAWQLPPVQLFEQHSVEAPHGARSCLHDAKGTHTLFVQVFEQHSLGDAQAKLAGLHPVGTQIAPTQLPEQQLPGLPHAAPATRQLPPPSTPASVGGPESTPPASVALPESVTPESRPAASAPQRPVLAQ